MLKKIHISTPSAQARDIAEILRLTTKIPNTSVDVGLGFDSPAQAGQYQRRIREALLEAHIDPDAFSFVRPKDSSALEISYVGIASDEDYVLASDAEAPAQPVEKPVPPSPITSLNGSSGFLEGKAILQDLTTTEKASGSYLVATLLIVEGPEKGQPFQDWLRRFPPHGRLPRFAEAFGVTADELVTKPTSLIGALVWVRRRKLNLPDGTSKTETLYYRIHTRMAGYLMAV